MGRSRGARFRRSDLGGRRRPPLQERPNNGARADSKGYERPGDPALPSGGIGGNNRLFDGLQKQVTLAGGLIGPITASQLPNNDTAESLVSGVGDLGAASGGIIEGYELVVGRAGRIDAEVSGLGIRIPVIALRLIVSGHDFGIGEGGHRGWAGPGLPWQRGVARGRTAASAPHTAVKAEPDSEFAGRDPM